MNTFTRLLEEVLMKTSLFEMAHKRQEAMDIIRSLQNTISIHFIKVALFPNHQDYTHWCLELETYLTQQIDDIRIKPNNRKLKYDDYFNILFDEPLGHEGSVFNKVKGLYRLKKIPFIPEIDYEKTRISLMKMYEELCDDLSIDNYEDIHKYIQLIRKEL